ncbi:MAG TPA: 50S ribosomal protein L25 [Buchnera sp. (in: enterobacteria)]|nr:50S ribosomal protein L25 [Buchnera sp. (in: enterobacteria)]
MLIIDGIIRDKHGKSASRYLRLNNKFPAIIYGKNSSNISIVLNHNILFNMQLKSSFYNKEILLLVNSVKYHVKVKSIQRHAFKPKLLHVDFIQI